MTRDEKRRQRKQQAEKRREERAKRSPLQQLQRLDELLGPGVGAQRERAKLVAELTGISNSEANALVTSGHGSASLPKRSHGQQ